jgi:hypothetical protein
MEFFGISTRPAGTWRRWTFCPLDKIYVSTDEAGMLPQTLTREPELGLFVRSSAKGE